MEFNLLDLLGQDDAEFVCQLPDELWTLDVPAPVTPNVSYGYELIPEPTSETPTSADGKTCPMPKCSKLLFRRHGRCAAIGSGLLWSLPSCSCARWSAAPTKVRGRTRWRAHTAQAHPAVFRDDADRKAQMALKLPRIIVNNFKYVDPKDVTPPSCLGRVLEPSIPAGVSQPSVT